MTFKRIISLLLVCLFISCVFLPIAVSADDTVSIDTSSVEEDLSYYYSDLGKTFPKVTTDKKNYLVQFVESGFDEINGVRSSSFALYVYVYNPSGKTLVNELNKIQFATSWSKGSSGELSASGYSKYELSLVNANDTNTLIKYKVANVDKKLVFYNEQRGTRRYDISGIELANSPYDIDDYTVGYTYTFSGFAKGLSAESALKSTLSCRRDDLFTIRVEAHQVSYLTGNSAKKSTNNDALYSNQINSVYFSVPKEIEEKYGALFSIKYEYNHFYTSPIIVTDNAISCSVLLNDRGKMVDASKWSYSIDDYNNSATSGYIIYFEFNYGHQSVNNAPLGYLGTQYIYDDAEVLPYLTTVFFKDGGWENGDVLFRASDLQAYFQNYKASYYTGKRLGYSADLFDLDKSAGYQVLIKDINEKFSLKGYNDSHNLLEYFADWGFRWNYKDFNNIDNIRYIEPITNSAFTDANFEKNYLVDDLYKNEFMNFYNTATANGENVYLLRYAIADDYYSHDLNGSGIDGNFIMCQGNVYLNFDFIEFGFGSSENLKIIPVVSDPTNGFFDGMDTTPDKSTLGDWLKELKVQLERLMKVFGIILLVLAVIAVVVLAFIFIKPLNDWFITLFGNGKKRSARPPKRQRTYRKRWYKKR